MKDLNKFEAIKMILGTVKQGRRPTFKPFLKKGIHTEDCASLPSSKAAKYLGSCYCNCGADESIINWKLWEEIDGTIQMFPVDIDPDALCFGRVRPICIIPGGIPFRFARLIAAAPDLLEALKYLTKEIHLGKLNVKKDFSLLNAHACATKAIHKAEGK